MNNRKQPPLTRQDGIQILIGILMFVGGFIWAYYYLPEVKAEVDKTWSVAKARLKLGLADIPVMPPARKLVEEGRKAQSNELTGLMLLDLTRSCERGDATACREIGEPTPKGAK